MAAMATMSFLLMGCIDEVEPTSLATAEQLTANSSATEALFGAMPASLSAIGNMGGNTSNEGKNYPNNHYDFGMGSMMHIRDIMGEDFVTTPNFYDWYGAWEHNQKLGRDRDEAKLVWCTFYKSILTTNLLIGAIHPEDASATQLFYLASGKAFRAALYLDLARMYEFLPNDGTNRIIADGKDVFALTVPFVFETTTEQDARNNPRVTHTEAFRYIKADLEYALEFFTEMEDDMAGKQFPDFYTTNGLLARAYLWHGSFLKEFGEEYDEEITANECFDKAAKYAHVAQGGGTPLTKAEWTNSQTGFNTMNDAWLWGFTIPRESDAVSSAVVNWTSWASNETVYGYSGQGIFLMVDPTFYDRIPMSDFRKLSWKAPSNSSLYDKLSYCDQSIFDGLPDYASLKIRPGHGNVVDFNVASAVSVPLMRVEEMYFIEMEALAQQGNESAAVELLTDFMRNIGARDPQYTYNNNDVIDEIFFQKRVEFWGEGINYFDYKRLNKGVTRGYPGTKFGTDAQMNTTTRPAWMNFVIPIDEINNNDAVRAYNNPNPSDCYERTDY